MSFGGNLLKPKMKSKTIEISKEHFLVGLLPMLGTLGYTKKSIDEIVSLSADSLPSTIKVTIKKENKKGANTSTQKS